MVSSPPARQRDRNGPRAALRLFVAAPLGPGARVPLSPGQAHYVAAVMRRRAGDALLLFNGRDGEWRARLAAEARGRRLEAVVEAQTRAQVGAPDLWLLFAPVKRTPVDRIARLATELGVAALRPVATARTAVARLNLDRLRANAIEAAEQCGRLTVPDCAATEPLDRALAAWPPERRLLFCDEAGGAPAGRALAAMRGEAASGPWAVLIGPEGGFSPEERAALRALPQSVAVSLGPRILRAETAAAAALALWQAALGDWNETAPARMAGL